MGNEDWSVLLEMAPESEHVYCRDALLSFVSNEAPVTSLRPGQAFYLFEGRWPVAEGVILQGQELDA
jgi:hypothetical protein